MYVLLRLLKLILLGAVVYIIYKLLWKDGGFFKSKKSSRSRQQHPQAAIEEMKKDPVCGTYIPENQAVIYKNGGQTYFFCSEECKQRFRGPGETKESARDE
jgi:YHS domain-containing protein